MKKIIKNNMIEIKTFESFSNNDDYVRASEIIGKEINANNIMQEITDFVEANIDNESMVKDVDELTTIKRNIKNI